MIKTGMATRTAATTAAFESRECVVVVNSTVNASMKGAHLTSPTHNPPIQSSPPAWDWQKKSGRRESSTRNFRHPRHLRIARQRRVRVKRLEPPVIKLSAVNNIQLVRRAVGVMQNQARHHDSILRPVRRAMKQMN